MEQYIPKSVVVAEVKRRIKETESMQPKFDQFWAGQISAFKGIVKILDTIEVKEVDLDREIDLWVRNLHSVPNFEELNKYARHFFELGLKVNCHVTASDRGRAEEIIVNLKRVENDYRIDLTKEIEWLRNISACK